MVSRKNTGDLIPYSDKFTSMKQLIFLFILFTFSQNISAQANQNLGEYLATNNIKTQTTPEGIHYSFAKNGKGEKPTTGKFAKINYRATLLDGTEFDRSEEGSPFVFEVGYQQVVRGLDRGIQLFSKGAKGTLYLPAKLAFGAKGKGKKVAANAPVIYEIELLEVMDYEAYDRYMRVLEEKEKDLYQQLEKQQLAKDKQIIKDYARANNLSIRELPSGVAFVINKIGKGPKIISKSLVEFNYEGYLPDGSFFDGEGRRDFKFWMGKGMLLDGLEQAMHYFKEGGTGLIMIPSKFAYGQRGIEEADTNIPENAVLIFDLEILKVRN